MTLDDGLAVLYGKNDAPFQGLLNSFFPVEMRAFRSGSMGRRGDAIAFHFVFRV